MSVCVTVRCPSVCPSVCLSRRSITGERRAGLVCRRSGADGRYRSVAAAGAVYPLSVEGQSVHTRHDKTVLSVSRPTTQDCRRYRPVSAARPRPSSTAGGVTDLIRGHVNAAGVAGVAATPQYFDKCFIYLFIFIFFSCLQCFDAVGWAAGRASGL